MKSFPCNLCGSNRLSPVYRKPDDVYFPDRWFDVVECRECGLGFVNPRPDEREIAAYYPAEYHQQLIDDDQQRRYNIEAELIEKSAGSIDGGRIFDIGCGSGGFLRIMASRGWTVEGVEPFSRLPLNDLPIHNRPLDATTGATGAFDVVTAWAVIEHVTDPMSYFEQASRLLKPGGRFVFLVTNFDSLSSRRLFKEDLPRHLFFFTRSTVTRYLDQNGLDLEHAEFDDTIYSLGVRGTLNYVFKRFVVRKPFLYDDLPPSYPAWLNERGLRKGAVGAIGFCLAHPISALDRVLEKVIARAMIHTGTYGIATYVAVKREC